MGTKYQEDKIINLISITEFRSKKASTGTSSQFTWDQLKAKLRTPVRTRETLAEYAAMSNEHRSEIKDVGGFVGGELKGGKRSKAALLSRSIITIDADNASCSDVDNFMCLYGEYMFCCHTTHSSTDAHPRLRWIFPLSRPVDAAEYRILAKVIGSWIGEDTLDDSTDQPERLMFWPSVSNDAEFRFWEGGDTVIDPDTIFLQEAKTIDTIEKAITSPASNMDETGTVLEGSRNKAVFGFACRLWHSGVSTDELHSMISTFNSNHCKPPLGRNELNFICRSVSKHNHGDLIPSALRDAYDNFSDLGEYVERKKSSAPSEKISAEKLEGITLKDLMAKHIPAPEYYIPDLIPVGLTVLVAPPKFGKSWLCLDMAISIATGTKVLDMQTVKHDVIYLALEDGEYRIQNRSTAVLGTREAPGNLHFIYEAPGLNSDLTEQLDKYIEEYKLSDCMIIIDTLQKVRGTAGRTEGVYGYDYREIGMLQRYALDRNIALVLVHHTNKGKIDSDFVSSINGSNGIAGAADSIISITKQRNSNDAKLEVTGRDVESQTYIVSFDPHSCRWQMIGKETAVKRDRLEETYLSDPITKTIKYALNVAEDRCNDPTVTIYHTAKSLAEETLHYYGATISPTSVGKSLMAYAHLLEKDGIEYVYHKSGDRKYSFSRHRKRAA